MSVRSKQLTPDFIDTVSFSTYHQTRLMIYSLTLDLSRLALLFGETKYRWNHWNRLSQKIKLDWIVKVYRVWPSHNTVHICDCKCHRLTLLREAVIPARKCFRFLYPDDGRFITGLNVRGGLGHCFTSGNFDCNIRRVTSPRIDRIELQEKRPHRSRSDWLWSIVSKVSNVSAWPRGGLP